MSNFVRESEKKLMDERTVLCDTLYESRPFQLKDVFVSKISDINLCSA